MIQVSKNNFVACSGNIRQVFSIYAKQGLVKVDVRFGTNMQSHPTIIFNTKDSKRSVYA